MIVWIAVALAGTCVPCHEDAAAEWASTRHAQSFTNASFQAAWTRHPDPWCLTCHAPEGDGDAGIGCVTCHVDGDVVLTSDRPPRAGERHHAQREADLGVALCVRCHQFAPPEASVPVQRTGEEYALSGVGETCAGCHMAGHRLAGARDQDFVRGALSVRFSPEESAVVLIADGVGHQVPTGDPFRQLVVEVLDGGDVRWQHRIGRAVVGVGASFAEAGDRRMPLPTRRGRSRLAVVVPKDRGARWRVRFVLTDTAHAELDAVERGWTLAEGRVPPAL